MIKIFFALFKNYTRNDKIGDLMRAPIQVEKVRAAPHKLHQVNEV